MKDLSGFSFGAYKSSHWDQLGKKLFDEYYEKP